MKRIFLLVTVLMMALATWADAYRIGIKNIPLNIMDGTGSDAKVIAKLHYNDTVYYENGKIPKEADYVKISFNGKTGYTRASFLKPLGVPDSELEKPKIRQEWWLKTKANRAVLYVLETTLGHYGKGYEWLTYVLVALALVMWVVCKFVRHLPVSFMSELPKPMKHRTFWRWFDTLFLLGTVGVVAFDVYKMGMNTFWFINPWLIDSWWIIARNLIIFIYLFIDLLVFFFMTLKDWADYVETDISVKIGMISWSLGMLVGIVMMMIGDLDYTILLYIMGGCQLLQIVLLLWWVGRKSLFAGLMSVGIYVIGSCTVMLFGSCLILWSVVLILAALGLYAFAKMTGKVAHPGSSFSGGWFSGHKLGSGGFGMVNEDGDTIELQADNDNGTVFKGSDGRMYTKDDGDSFRKL